MPRSYTVRSSVSPANGRTGACRTYTEELAQKFEPTAESIRNWVKQAEIDDGQRRDGLSTDEKQELARLRRENKHTDRAGDPGKSSRLVRTGDRLGTTQVYEFVKAHQEHIRLPRCEACWKSPPAGTMRGASDSLPGGRSRTAA